MFLMESDADDDMPMSHAVGSSSLHYSDHDFPSTMVDSSAPQARFRANHFSPLSAEIDDEPLSTTVGDAPFRGRLTLVGVARGGDSEQRVGGDRDPRCGDFLEGPDSGISDVEGMLDPVVGQGEPTLTLTTAACLQEGDVYVVCSPDRVWDIHEELRTQLWAHAKIQMHKGKTQVWNRGGVAPDGWERLGAEAQRSDSDAVV